MVEFKFIPDDNLQTVFFRNFMRKEDRVDPLDEHWRSKDEINDALAFCF